MKAHIVLHFDKEDYSWEGEYREVDVVVDDKLIQKYGDDYHDKGYERAEGFINGLKFANKYLDGGLELLVSKRQEVADWEY